MFNTSGWSYTTSSGAALTAGEGVEGTYQRIYLYIKSPNGVIYRITATGAGTGFGASIFPASITGSLASFPSKGSQIYSMYNETITLADLSGMLMIYSGGLTASQGNISLSLVIFLHSRWYGYASGAIPIVGPAIAFSQIVKAFCWMGSSQLSTTNLSADFLGTLYLATNAVPM